MAKSNKICKILQEKSCKSGGYWKSYIHSSFNNIIISLTNNNGEVISWASAGKMGFRGSKKNTPYAAQMAAQECAKVAYDLGLRKVKAYVRGLVLVVNQPYVLFTPRV